MKKRIILLLLSVFCVSMLTYGVDAWIRINQLGYLPNAQKKAIFQSESPLKLKKFTIHDALTNKELATFTTIIDKGGFQLYYSNYILDFSAFKTQGAFYIKAGLIYSPTIYINKNVYLGSADFLLKYMREQRCGFNPSLNVNCHQSDGYDVYSEEQKPVEPKNNELSGINSTTKKIKSSKRIEESTFEEPSKPKFVDVKGGWHDASDYIQYGATSANAVYQMLFAYQMNPTSFADAHSASGKAFSNGIPDILDEARWGLYWLIKMYPSKEVLYHQIADDRDHVSPRLPSEDNVDYGWGAGTGRPVYLATGKPQGLFKNKNNSTGIASIAGKYSSAFGLGAEIFSGLFPSFADSLKRKAIEAYQYGKKYPGVCQSVPGKYPGFYEEGNWTDDMELAAAQLYHLTYEKKYLIEATEFGRLEPVSPWMCSDSAHHFQWYPFINLGHFILANVDNPRFQREYTQDLLNGIQRMSSYAKTNPFNVGVPFIRNSNNLVVALATQCRLYRTISGDSTYFEMETALVDWLFGRNPWGTSMIVGLPKFGDTPSDPYSALWLSKHIPPSGGLVDGPVQASTFKNLTGNRLSKADKYEQFQSNWAVYHDDVTDFSTNEPAIDGTASLTYLLSSKQFEGVQEKTADKNQYTFGGITRTDNDKKQISLVFTGNEYGDGYNTIRKTLKKLNIKASFFFTGDFYRRHKFKHVVKGLLKDKHYLGGNSDKNLLYCSLQKRDTLLVTKTEFLNDLKANYAAMQKFDIDKNQAPFFLPSYEWYNDSISSWCKEVGVQLVNFTPGTLSTTDASTPEMREQYYSSTEIYNKILSVELKQGLNGNILLFHIGSDRRRKDKFYPKLYSLLSTLTKSGYNFVDLYQATDVIDKDKPESDKKQKRKN